MFVWINGPFGVGKTTTARALLRLAAREGRPARIYDPEMFGALLQRTIPRQLRPSDFRDQRAWDLATHAAVRLLSRRPGWLVVPMTIARPIQLDALTRGACGRIFQLTAPRALIEKRIHERDHAIAWSMSHLATWPDRDDLGERIDAAGSPDAVARAISDALVRG